MIKKTDSINSVESKYSSNHWNNKMRSEKQFEYFNAEEEDPYEAIANRDLICDTPTSRNSRNGRTSGYRQIIKKP